MKKLTIDREKWHRGKGSTGSALYVRDQGYCCLGFLSKACHLTDEQIEEESTPAYLPAELRAFLPQELFDEEDPELNSKWTTRAVVLNDEHPRGSKQEAALTSHFAMIGYELEFIN